MSDKSIPTQSVLTIYMTNGSPLTYNLTASVGANIASEISLAWGGDTSYASVSPASNDVINCSFIQRYTIAYS